jgi:hypothetical protein
MAGEAGRELRHQGDAQAQRLEQALRDFGGQLRGAARGEPLPEGRGRDLAQQAGSALTGWADRLADGGVDGVLRDVSSFARRRPGLFLAGAAAVGFVAGRTFRGMQGASSAAPEPPSDTSLSGSMPAAAGLPAGGVAELGDSTVPLGGA